jgi:hypothetical protein
MKTLKSFLLWLILCTAMVLLQPKAVAQHSEIGVRVVLSGALLFGPYYVFWVDDHNAITCSAFAALEEGYQVIPLFALNAGYSAYFLNEKWRPEIGLQYSYLIAPRKHKSSADPGGVSILSLLPGVQFRWDQSCQNTQSRLWIAYFLDKPRTGKKNKIYPIGIDFSYGYKFQ